MSDEVRDMIHGAATAYAEAHAESGHVRDMDVVRQQFISDWQVRLSVVLQRGSAHAVIARTRRDCAAVGRQYTGRHGGRLFYFDS